MQDDLPGRRGALAFDDRTGTRLGIVVQREERGPAKPCSRRLGIQIAGSQHGDGGVSERFPWRRGVATVPPLRRLRPIGPRSESTQAFTAENLDSDNGPAPIVGDDLALESPVGNSGVVPMSSHPSCLLPGHAHPLLAPAAKIPWTWRAHQLDGPKMSALREQ